MPLIPHINADLRSLEAAGLSPHLQSNHFREVTDFLVEWFTDVTESIGFLKLKYYYFRGSAKVRRNTPILCEKR
jgi:hypothetical protein